MPLLFLHIHCSAYVFVNICEINNRLNDAKKRKFKSGALDLQLEFLSFVLLLTFDERFLE